MKFTKFFGRKVTGLVLSAVIGISAAANTCFVFAAENDEIVVLYTNDVHCGIDDAIGYAGLAAYKKELEQNGTPTLLVDCGDHAQGGIIGALSRGEAIIEIMNAVGYDLAVPGNHDFDYTVPQFMKFTQLAEFPYLCCNFIDLRTNKPVLAPYAVREIGGKRIGFVGAVTPQTIISSTPRYFQDENENDIYNFSPNNDGKELYDAVQKAVDEVRGENVDYVILLAHLGIEKTAAPYMSTDVIRNTSGIDAVLDGHSHSVVEMEKVKNKDGQSVVLTQTGTKLHSIGKLTLDGDEIKSELISDYTKKDSETEQFINKIKTEYDKILKQQVGKTDFPLRATVPGDDSEWLVRNNETNMGDFCADAYKYAAKADIAVVNGGGVRDNIPAGDITYEDLLAVNPFGNDIVKIKIKGSDLANALEYSVSHAPEPFGGFLQVSGISFDIDLDKNAGITTDESGLLIGMKGSERRVSNIKINGEPLDGDKAYTLASIGYILLEDGDGNTAFKGEELALEKPIKDIDALISYLKDELGGVMPEKYADVYGEERIRFVGEEQAEISVLFNGANLETDSAPYIKNSCTMVPARAIFEALGAEVDFDAETKTVSAKKDDAFVKIEINGLSAFVNGEEVSLAAPAEIKNSRTMVPLRFVSDAFNAQTDWDSETKTAKITAD